MNNYLYQVIDLLTQLAQAANNKVIVEIVPLNAHRSIMLCAVPGENSVEVLARAMMEYPAEMATGLYYETYALNMLLGSVESDAEKSEQGLGDQIKKHSARIIELLSEKHQLQEELRSK